MTNALNGKDKTRLAYYAERYMLQQTGTKSLAKLDRLLTEEPGNVVRYSVSAYLFFTDFDKKDSNKLKFKTLNSLLKEFNDHAFVESEGKNKFKDAVNASYYELKKKYNKAKNKDKLRDDLLSYFKSTDLSLNFVAKECSVKYSNLYNFLYKKDNNKLSQTKAASVKMFFKNSVV